MLLDLLNALPCPFSKRVEVAEDLDDVTHFGLEHEVVGEEAADGIEAIWEAACDLYRTGTQPGIQLCIRHEGEVVLQRAIGHARGNSPGDTPETPKVPLTVDTPVGIFSASKAITAMVIHKLDEQNVLRLDDHVCDYIPEFGRHGKDEITIRHVLCHRAGVPNLPPEAFDLDLLGEPGRVLELLCETRVQTRPGRLLAYHAVTGGFILAEVVQRATGRDIRDVLETEISRPLGLQWMSYGVRPESLHEVALNAFTGPPIPPPLAQILQRAIGTPIERAIELSNDPRFLTGIIPSANIVTTADEASIFYQCLLDGGRYAGETVFEPRTVRHATSEQSWWELDLTLGFPVRYGVGFMLGSRGVGLLGSDNPHAFGHVGLSNVFTWADPERHLSVALLTTGKAIVSPHVIPLFALIRSIGNAFPRCDPAARAARFPIFAPTSDAIH